MEGPLRPYHHDRHPHRRPVVHLRRRQGGPEPAPAPAPRDARVPQEKTRRPAGLSPPLGEMGGFASFVTGYNENHAHITYGHFVHLERLLNKFYWSK